MRRANMATMASPSPAPTPTVFPARLKRWVSAGSSSDRHADRRRRRPDDAARLAAAPTRIQRPPDPCAIAFSTRFRKRGQPRRDLHERRTGDGVGCPVHAPAAAGRGETPRPSSALPGPGRPIRVSTARSPRRAPAPAGARRAVTVGPWIRSGGLPAPRARVVPQRATMSSCAGASAAAIGVRRLVRAVVGEAALRLQRRRHAAGSWLVASTAGRISVADAGHRQQAHRLRVALAHYLRGPLHMVLQGPGGAQHHEGREREQRRASGAVSHSTAREQRLAPLSQRICAMRYRPIGLITQRGDAPAVSVDRDPRAVASSRRSPGRCLSEAVPRRVVDDRYAKRSCGGFVTARAWAFASTLAVTARSRRPADEGYEDQARFRQPGSVGLAVDQTLQHDGAADHARQPQQGKAKHDAARQARIQRARAAGEARAPVRPTSVRSWSAAVVLRVSALPQR